MNLDSIQNHTWKYKSKTYSKFLNNQVNSERKNNTSKLQYSTKKRQQLYKGKYIFKIEVYVSRVEKKVVKTKIIKSMGWYKKG